MRFSPFVERIRGQGVTARELHPPTHDDAGGESRATNLLHVAGPQNALLATTLCLLTAGDEVLALDSMPLQHQAVLQASGATLVRVACSAEECSTFDATLLAKAISPRSRAIVLANSQANSGVPFNPETLQAIADLAIAHDLWVVLDVGDAGQISDGEHQGLAALPGMAERCVVIGSLSKSHAMTGWRTGWIVADQALVAHAETLVLSMLYGLPGFVMEAALTAVQAHDEVTHGMRDIYRHRRDLVVAGLADCPGISVLTPDAGMFVLIDVREADEFAAGHLPGAVLVPRGLLEFKLTGTPALSSRDLKVVLYCKTSGRAALSAQAMQSMGYLNVTSIAGGYDAWAAAGKPVVKPESPSFE